MGSHLALNWSKIKLKHFKLPPCNEKCCLLLLKKAFHCPYFPSHIKELYIQHNSQDFCAEKYTSTHCLKITQNVAFEFWHFQPIFVVPEKFIFALDGNSIGEVVVPEGGFWELGQFESDYGEGMVNPWKEYAKNAPFDKDFYLVLNMAVGGTM